MIPYLRLPPITPDLLSPSPAAGRGLIGRPMQYNRRLAAGDVCFLQPTAPKEDLRIYPRTFEQDSLRRQTRREVIQTMYNQLLCETPLESWRNCYQLITHA